MIRAGNASWREFIKRPMLPRRIVDLMLPTLVVHGSEDIRPSWPAHQIANLMPNARFELIEGAEHHLEPTRPDDLRQRLRSFLRDVPTEERNPG